MSEFLRRVRLPLLFAALVFGTLALMLGDRRPAPDDRHWAVHALLEIAAPIQKAITRPVHFVRDTWQRYVALVDLELENRELRERLARLEHDNLQFREALVASGQLQRIAQMRREFEVPLLPARVVGQDASAWSQALLLDRGRSAEVRSGMPVLVDQGLVGLVNATTPHAARAMLVLDRRSAVDAMIQRSRARGLVRGLGGEELEFVFMVRGDDVQVGDEVITAGVGGVYPKGIRVGTIVSVKAEREELLHTARVRPAVDFGRLEQVFVVLQRGPTMDLLFGGGDGDLPAQEPSTLAKPSAVAEQR
jgi:rod shape-determining protein MreC